MGRSSTFLTFSPDNRQPVTARTTKIYSIDSRD